MAVARCSLLLALISLAAYAQAAPPPTGGSLVTASDGADVIEAARLIDTVKCFDDEGLAQIRGLLDQAIAQASPKINVRAYVERARYSFLAGSGCTTKVSDAALKAARMDLKLALSVAPESTAALIQLARADTQLGRHDEAQASLDKAQALGARDAQLHLHRALAYAATKNWSAAAQAMSKVPACRANRSQPAQCGGRLGAQAKIELYTAMRDRTATLRAYREATKAFPQSAFMHGNYAEYLLYQVGDVSGALTEIDKSLAIRPNLTVEQTRAVARYAQWAQRRTNNPAAATRLRQQAETALPADEVMPLIACGIGGNPATQGLATALAQTGTAIDARRSGGDTTALMTAAVCGQPADLAWLLAHNAAPKLSNRDGHTAFALAAYAGRLDNVEALLPIADLNATDREGDTPLLLAAYENHTAVALRLIQAKADINHANDNGDTALIRAAQHANEPLVRALLAAGADTQPRSKDEPKDAAEWAEGAGRKELAEMIRGR